MMKKIPESGSPSPVKSQIDMPKPEGATKKIILKVVFALVVAVIVLSAVFGIGKLVMNRSRSGYYAVFLSNGQAYFGTISNENERSLELHNVYYIQKNPDAAQAAPNDLTLLKLGNEVHGPEDMMEIYKGQIIFIEKLKSDSKVVKAIQNYKQ